MSIYDSLNPPQREAVFYTEGPLLILAGAGSGKTRVLTHRIAYLIEEKNVSPWNILAITFTNKAAGEMRDRVDALVGPGSEAVWVSTFHSCCVRILRRYIDRIGYATNFIIYDSEDQKSLIKGILRRLGYDSQDYPYRSVLAKISSYKNDGLSTEDVKKQSFEDGYDEDYALLYGEYQSALEANNALDFDDLLLKCVELFESVPEVLEYYQERFRYIMVDEYQDTNNVQFRLISLLAMRYQNLCVVGDDDQSIYKFRGADIRNILDFEETYPDAKVVRLEQNYRSTENILRCANAVISNNRYRKEKALWTEKKDGPLVHLRSFMNDYSEAEYIIGEIARRSQMEGIPYAKFAILYRTNAQSRLFEEKLYRSDIPYKIIGGINFYSRKEIKDVLSYLRSLENPVDDLSIQRILSVGMEGFGKGIGKKTMDALQSYAVNESFSLYRAMANVSDCPGLGPAAKKKVLAFVENMEGLKRKIGSVYAKEALETVLSVTGYKAALEAEKTEESEARLENIGELVSKAAALEESCKETAEIPSLGLFLEQIALVSDIDVVEESKEYVTLMTLHSAKGLEFPIVYMPGMEENLFPSYRALSSPDIIDLEEERRLCYVGITRAMDELTLSWAKLRFINGDNRQNRMSEFIQEIPREFLDEGDTFGRPYASPVMEQVKKSVPMQDSLQKVVSPKPSEKLMALKGAPTAKGEGELPYQVGDEVRHIKFGNGVVKEIVDGGRDFEVTVVFDSYGQKKMFAGFAKLVKI